MNLGILYRSFNRTDSLNTHIARPCLYRWYVTGLLSLPLTKVSSVQELIVVVKDAMKAYSEFNTRIDIVHRNLMPDVIRFHYLEGGRVKGMLADFAQVYNSKLCAVDKEKNIATSPPFMSVNMIERNSTPITKLDDWESLINVPIWMGLQGLNHLAVGTETEAEKRARLSLFKEQDENAGWSVPRNNRMFLDSEANFSRILDGSNKHVLGYEMLWSLLKDLRAALIENNGYNEDCAGAEIRDKICGELGTADDKTTDILLLIDPFKVHPKFRGFHCPEIVESA
ncbi:hypothetical protein LPJ66_000955 [Kickxella alabastrina]|uniref:Uncharacterized protein n=1 Tax=Kickxella alabastrina TaxID=61397 RepID=A0ACC1IUJ7_9FUNG|nr:hypothetical protein LPJ66_000955 [Kickxella alabastrina]